MRLRRRTTLKTAFVFGAATMLLMTTAATAADIQRAAMMRVGTLYISPDKASAKLGEVDRGREVIVIETSGGWVRVEANLTEERTVSGWMLDKGIVRASTPNGDRVLYGEAVDSEDQASQRHGRRGAAQDAMRLYYRVGEYFPSSPLAGEAMYRSADIRWQIEKADVMTRPSARERQSYMRGQMHEEWMKLVLKKYPGTKWADLAAFRMIDNKLCGEWEGLSKCPDKEADLYENYAKEHPQSPAAPESLYNAAWRRSALIEIFKAEPNQKKSAESKDRALALAQKLVSQYGQGDWAFRAARLIFFIQQGVPTYGNASD